MRVLVIDDSALMRRVISGAIEHAGGMTLAGTARDGLDGLEKIRDLSPDLVTLDIEMPRLDGISTLRKLRAELGDRAPVVLMCSTLTRKGSNEAIQAMHLGAADVVLKDIASVQGGSAGFTTELISKARALVSARRKARPVDRPAPCAKAVRHRDGWSPDRVLPGAVEVVVIGSSTGGPPVLEALLKPLPADLTAPIVIAQHMPALFTESLAERLDAECALTVRHGANGMPLIPGEVVIVPGGSHGKIRKTVRRLQLVVGDEPQAALYRPSVDELLGTAGETCSNRVLAAVMTGMGEDGAVGAKRLHELRATVLAQNEGTCVVYGMPAAVARGGNADAELPPEAISEIIARLSKSNADRLRAA
ncbi:MAG: chemotaxis-specific protein-glutamate methyltransferase CheB [Planctomycetota bacterium]